MHKTFEEDLKVYSRLKGYITEDEILGINLVNETFDHLNAIINDKKLIKKIDKKFIPFVKKLEPGSTVIYIDAC